MNSVDINNEINEEEVKVEEIMEKVRENIRKRKEAENFSEKSNETIHEDLLSDEALSDNGVQKDLDYANSNWDIRNNSYFISSHRPIMGKFLVKGRGLVNGEIRRYIDPIVWKQIEFNRTTARLLNVTGSKLGNYNNKIGRLKYDIDNKIEQLRLESQNEIEQLKPDLENKIEQLKPEFENKIEQLKAEIDNSIRTEINSTISLINQDIDNKAWLASILEDKIKEGQKSKQIETPDSEDLNINYFVFEEQFRGSREDIKQRQSNFLNYFVQCSNVLDIGCGRGEFLELLKEHGIGVKGIDIDDTMVDYCLSRGLPIAKDDAISYLEKLEDKSLDGIFIDQVVEHLQPDYLIKLLSLCYQKLKYGYYIVIETVNPLSLFSFANFYIDLTHIKPVHPETLKFLLKSSGFRDLDIKFISPVPAESRLKKLSTHSEIQNISASFIEVYNQNIDMLNNILYGAQDYAVIGKK